MPKKILLVEDEELIIELLERKLSQAGYEIVVARNGEEGLEKLRTMEKKPDLVLLDIIMPKKGGFEVMEEIRKDENLEKNSSNYNFKFWTTCRVR